MAKRTTFRRAISQVAREARSKGEITVRESLMVHWAAWTHHKDLRGFCVTEGVAAGAIPPASAERPEEIDWDAILEFLKDLLPLILEFIKALLVIF